ncbi:MAG TPA: immunoglobulin domain-containing protein, partial [Acidimicrobiales bacterium]|nr:immunoglobulin domain-containing protein [Acidimicrobiales bacterium]
MATALPLLAGGSLATAPPAAAVQSLAYVGNLATDFQTAVSQGTTPSNPFGPWQFFGAPEATSNGAAVDQTNTLTYSPLTTYSSNNTGLSCGSDDVWSGGSPGGYAIYAPTTVAQNQCGSWHYPAGTVALAPANSSTDAGVTWTAPAAGVVTITGSIWDDDPGGGNGILWYLNHGSAELASGGFGNGGSQDLTTGAGTSTVAESGGGAALRSVSVNRGDTLSLLVDPNLDYSYDNTGVQLVISYDSYAAAVTADAPTTYYRFDDSTKSTDLTDSADQPTSGTYYAGTTLGQPGAVASGDAAVASRTAASGGGVASAPSVAPALTGPGARSFEVWEKSTSLGANSTSVCAGAPNDCQALATYGGQSSGQLFEPSFSQHQVMLWGYGDNAYQTTPVNLDDGNWHQIVMTYDGANAVTFYVDGQSIGTDANPGDMPYALSPTQSQLLIGDRPSWASNWSSPFVGSLDEMAFLPGQLSATDIAQQYHDGAPSPAEVTLEPASQTVSSGTSVSFTAAGAGNPPPTVQWQVEAAGASTFSPISGATSTTYTFTPTASDDGSQFEAVFTNNLGTATSSPATLTVLYAPVVTSQPSSQTVSSGSSVSFTSAAAGDPSPTVQWQVEPAGASTFTPIPNATSTTYTFTASAANDGSQYEAVFTNSQGSATSSPATLTVLYAPVVTTQPSSQTVSPGSSVTFTSAAAGDPSPTVQWQVEPAG